MHASYVQSIYKSSVIFSTTRRYGHFLSQMTHLQITDDHTSIIVFVSIKMECYTISMLSPFRCLIDIPVNLCINSFPISSMFYALNGVGNSWVWVRMVLVQ